MRCHYEVLAVERDVGAKEVKKAFHVQALRWHPDKHQKNNISSDEATLRFQEIQSAYEVLSDAHERKWYDDHREQILRGDDGNGGNGGDDDDEGGDGLNLFRYFRCVCVYVWLLCGLLGWVDNHWVCCVLCVQPFGVFWFWQGREEFLLGLRRALHEGTCRL